MNLTAAISTHAAERPRATALITQSLTLDYAALDAAIWRMAGYLTSQGVKRGDRLGVVIDRCAVGAIVALAITRLGAAQYWFAPADGREVHALAVRVFGLGRLVTDCGADGAAFLGTIALAPTLDAYAGLPADPFELADDSDMPWLGLMSSGTTGNPKALFQTHDQTAKRYLTCRSTLPMLVYDRVFSLPAMHFATTMQRLHWSGLSGGAFVLPDTYAVPVPVDFINSSRTSVLWVTPFHLQSLIAVAKHRQVDGALLPHVRDLLCSTAATDDDLRDVARRWIAPNMINAYGATEIGFLSASGSFGTGTAPGSIGYPVPGVEIQVVDEGGGVIEQSGRIGVIRARSSTMTTEYLGDPEMTARYFRGGWFYPGDLAAWNDDGQLIFHGRMDDMMIHDGINIYPAEIETVLLKHPAVAEAVAFPLKSREHQDTPAAAIIVRQAFDNAELMAFCRDRLGLKAPRSVLVVEEFPRNPAGKILTSVLAERLQKVARRN